MRSVRRDETGMALITVFMVLMLAAALMVGFFAAISADQRTNGIDRDQTQAYAAAHAGLEKLTSDMAALFNSDYSPSAAQINNLMTFAPAIPGFSYIAPGGGAGSGYSVTFTPDPCASCPNKGNPIPDSATGTTITSGPYKDFKGIITRYPITITARSTGGAEVRLRREVQTVAVPVFQFGVFSETDLSFWAGDDFNFGGRVQTNGNLFLAESTAGTLTLSDRVTAFKEVVRKYLSNGKIAADNSFDGTVNIIDTTAGHLRPLTMTEGSVTTMPGAGQTLNTNWTTISTGTYKSLLRNGLTGAKYLSLPLVSAGAQPIDLIKRPVVGEDTTKPLVLAQRYYTMASMRILLSDTAAEITSLPGIAAGAPVPLDGTATSAQYGPIGTTQATYNRPPWPTSPGLSSLTGTTGYQMTAASAVSGTAPNQTFSVGTIPDYFKMPATMKIWNSAHTVSNTIVCAGRSANTTLKGCKLSAAGTGTVFSAGSTIEADVPSPTVATSTAKMTVIARMTTSSWTPPIFSGSGSDVAVDVTGTWRGTAPFAPTAFWLHSTLGGDGGPFTCTGYTATSFTGCSGIPTTLASGAIFSTGSLEARGTALNRGFIKIEIQNSATPPVWVDVTTEVLNLGFSGPKNGDASCDPTPNAIIRMHHLRDNPGGLCVSNVGSANSLDYWPNVLYDTREGTLRPATGDQDNQNIAFSGIMNYVSLDVGNLKKWLAGTAPFNTLAPSGTSTLVQNGYIVYFSDRRGNKNQASPAVETGEYGFEDMLNPTVADGKPPFGDGTLQTGEDLNQYVPVAPAVYTPVLDNYGMYPQNAIAGTELVSTKRPFNTTTNQWVGMMNRPIFFRRALKLVNGASGNLPTTGLTVAAENPVYVHGNYNATSALAVNETHAPAAILADAVTILSSGWNDANSFQSPNDSHEGSPVADKPGRRAATTGYRFAVVAGKSLSFPYPTTGTPQFLFGTDGAVSNFLHYLEDWLSPAATIRYRGSIVSLYISRQAVGTYKYATSVYDYSTREYNFETEFLLPALLPPGTPMFRDINTLTFRQLLRPNQ